MAARALVMDVAREVRVGDVLKEHDAELRAIPGVTMLGTHSGGGDPAHIVVYVDKVTPEVRAAVPATLDGYRVDVEAELVLPPSPPMLVGVVKNVTPATPEQAAAGIAGVLTIEGDLYKVGYGESKPSPRTMVVLVPSALQIWRPQGEGKEFISLADANVGETDELLAFALRPPDLQCTGHEHDHRAGRRLRLAVAHLVEVALDRQDAGDPGGGLLRRRRGDVFHHTDQHRRRRGQDELRLDVYAVAIECGRHRCPHLGRNLVDVHDDVGRIAAAGVRAQHRDAGDRAQLGVVFFEHVADPHFPCDIHDQGACCHAHADDEHDGETDEYPQLPAHDRTFPGPSPQAMILTLL